MHKRVYLGLFFLGLFTSFASAYLETSPGYMDAYYYYYNGVQLAEGSGFNEMFLWNYLDSPTGLPHPAFSYWMPLTSLVAAGGIKLFAGICGVFRGAQMSFILIAASIPPLSARLAWEFTGKRNLAIFSGLLAVFMGYFQPYVVAVDAFGIYMLLGCMFFLTAIQEWRWKYILLGLLAGLLHLTRADGLLWLGMVVLAVVLESSKEDEHHLVRRIFNKKNLLIGLFALGGYLLILSPWLLRNYLEFGSLLSPGGSSTIWVLDYDELFAYPADVLTFTRWKEAGLSALLSVRFEALLLNLQSTGASLGMIFPGVLAILGAFRCRKERIVQLGFSYWLLLILVMSLIFPFAGIRGGFFHSGAGLMPLIWVLIPLGVDLLTEWSVKTFKWEARKIKPFYVGLLFLYVIFFSFGVLFTSIIGTDPEEQPIWETTSRQYLEVESVLEGLGADPQAVIVAATPPAYTAVTGRPSIAMPDGGLVPLFAVIYRYQATYVLVEENHPDEMEALFINPGDTEGLTYLGTFAGIHLFVLERGQ